MLVFCCYKKVGGVQYDTFQFLKANIQFITPIVFCIAFFTLFYDLLSKSASNELPESTEKIFLALEGIVLFFLNYMINRYFDLNVLVSFFIFNFLVFLVAWANFEVSMQCNLISYFIDRRTKDEYGFIEASLHFATLIFLFSSLMLTKQVSSLELENFTVDFD
jgi:uncharacterized membrane protein